MENVVPYKASQRESRRRQARRAPARTELWALWLLEREPCHEFDCNSRHADFPNVVCLTHWLRDKVLESTREMETGAGP